MAVFIVWNDTFRVGHELMDQQHKALFALINRLHQEMRHKADSIQLGQTLQELRMYGEEHLASEEALMARLKFPDLEAHQDVHHLYRNKIAAFQGELVRVGESLAFDLLRFLRQWWTNHILELDFRYKPYL